MKRMLGAATAAFIACSAQAQAQPSGTDWGAALRRDAQTIHDTFRDSHPGYVDPENPGFRGVLERGLQTALARAERADSQAAWWWALREYIASFDDGHVGVGLVNGVNLGDVAWPGFLTAYRGDDQVVAVRETDAAPPLGAKLVSCDGKGAAELAADRVGRFRGRWFLESQRSRWGPQLLVDWNNPYVPELRSCVFETDGVRTAWPLEWRGVSLERLSPKFDAASQGHRGEIGMRRLADGTVWISLPTFDGGGAENVKALEALVAEVKAELTEIRSAPRIVFDLRGNSGGSSAWGYELARLLWGAPYVAARTPRSEGVDWRLSEENVRHIDDLIAQLSRRTPKPTEFIEGLERMRAEAAADLAAGKPYWRQPPGDGADPDMGARSELGAPVFAVTDGVCASACLDAMDLWKALGVVQVGRETSADTVYMEVRGKRLPSGTANLNIPVKVYRGRPRGHNVTYRPDHRFDGSMADTEALARWIATLPTPGRS